MRPQSSPVIVAVTRTRRNESRCSNRAGTLEQLHEVKERQSLYSMRNGPMENIMEDRRDVVILPPVTNEPCCSIEYRLESVQEAHRHSGEQAVAVVNPRSDKSGDIRLRSPKRQRLDATPEKTELAKATAYRPPNLAPH